MFEMAAWVSCNLAGIFAGNYSGPYFDTLSTISIRTASSTVVIFWYQIKPCTYYSKKSKSIQEPNFDKSSVPQKIENNKPCSGSPRQMKKIFPVEENIKYSCILIYSNNCHSRSYTCHRPPDKLFYLVSEKNSNGDMFRSMNVMVSKEQQGPHGTTIHI